MGSLRLAGLKKSFGSVRAVDATNLDFAQGKLTALLGPSGCGKTTLLRMIAGLEAPSGGGIFLGERDITALPAHKRKFGMVFQSFALFPHLNVRDNVAYGLMIRGMDKAERYREAEQLVQREFMSERLVRSHQTLGDLTLDVPGHAEVDDFRRELSLRDGIARVRYRVGDDGARYVAVCVPAFALERAHRDDSS